MRLIYLDEAGTSAREPVTVVVGVIVKPDDHWMAVRQEISALVQTIPEQYRDGFIFHAKSVWADPKYRDGWPKDDRVKFIKSFAAIPQKFGLSIALGKVRRDAGGQELLDKSGLNKVFSLSQWQHALAFMACVQKANGYMRERCDDGEIAILIAEDVPEMRTHLRNFFEIAKKFYVSPDLLGVGSFHQGISHIQDGIHFASKSQAPLLQVADACAFCFRRFLSEQSYGEEFARAMGCQMDLQEWLGPESAAIFTSDPLKRASLYPDRFPGEGLSARRP